ncbi:uncharacterized protein LOC119078675 isoform X2 [Bradysia coprophila]|uniref:uncharacterized protein LOC119078675 isoform X2 n=1 Tax=Bradysia coprophila TaxID=38358 RepID=UPI00187DC1FF|nr:uncharacterized protein LOC119078675 isoform X2 [Bradysia coprophila]
MGIYGKINILCAIFMICIILNDCFVSGKSVPIKRRVSPDENEEHIDNSVDRIRYDEYPLVVPKRAAILLDRIMVALHHALEDGDQKEIRKISELYKDSNRYTEDIHNISDYLPAEMDLTDINNQENRLPDDMMGLQRRGNGESGLSPSKGRVYWRCYFNAVTCF